MEKTIKTAWDFVSKYYPDYYHCDEIAENDDLAKLVDKEYEEGDCAHRLLMEKYNGDLDNPQIQLDFDASLKYVYEKAIENQIKLQEKRSGLEIETTLVLSTSHLPQEEFEQLSEEEDEEDMPFRILNHEYGTLLILAKLDVKEYSHIFTQLKERYPQLFKVVMFALELEVKSINFDQDVEVIEQLETFDW